MKGLPGGYEKAIWTTGLFLGVVLVSLVGSCQKVRVGLGAFGCRCSIRRRPNEEHDDRKKGVFPRVDGRTS